MLDSLHIENIAVIERADIEFSAGFNVLTGETGAGKSILIDSINAVLGNRTSKELIRSGCERASVSAVFSSLGDEVRQKLCELGFDSDDDELCIQRVITESKSNVKINGINTTASILREIAPLLVNIHGQHDSQALLDPDKHYIYIDLLADNANLLDSYYAAFSAMMSTRRRLKTLTAAAEQNAHDLEILQYQVNELESANIEIGEIERLKTRQRELENAKEIADNMNTASALIADNDYDDTQSVLGLVDSALEQLSAVANVSDNIAALYSELDGVRESLADINERIE
ncbi:MAG: AAA family ATPase, partial [Acutalibacteraceae bacterium]